MELGKKEEKIKKTRKKDNENQKKMERRKLYKVQSPSPLHLSPFLV